MGAKSPDSGRRAGHAARRAPSSEPRGWIGDPLSNSVSRGPSPRLPILAAEVEVHRPASLHHRPHRAGLRVGLDAEEPGRVIAQHLDRAVGRREPEDPRRRVVLEAERRRGIDPIGVDRNDVAAGRSVPGSPFGSPSGPAGGSPSRKTMLRLAESTYT